jgi:hypothetical protein
MKSLRTRLQEGDPVAHEPPLSRADADRLRRAVFEAGVTAAPRVKMRHRRAWAAVGAVAVMAAAAGVSRWSHAIRDDRAAPSGVRVDSSSRQLQFATPGGTRVIWVFSSDLQR